ncbi:MAG: hypothetical protein ACRC33_19720 [Gemmataceae bacterium]
MIPAPLVRADVIDVRDGSKPVPASYAIDANVLYFLFYPNFQALFQAGGGVPHASQLSAYQGWHFRAEAEGAIALAATITLGEYARLDEYAEWEAFWLYHPNRVQIDPLRPETRFSPRLCKACRYAYPSDLSRIRRLTDAQLGRVLSVVQLLPALPDAATTLRHSRAEWGSSAGDFPDAELVATARNSGIGAILSDDVDLITFAGVTVYTANQRAIDSARAAGKLLSSGTASL